MNVLLSPKIHGTSKAQEARSTDSPTRFSGLIHSKCSLGLSRVPGPGLRLEGVRGEQVVESQPLVRRVR